tara:strand:- start:2170 stop:3108 length:939 start_codon:yes stop_codon:yes gene_type:complete
MSDLNLVPTQCPLCKDADDVEIYPGTFSPDSFSAEIFSARRLPDQVHYRIVRCDECGLIRSNPVIEFSRLDQLYEESLFTYGDEVENITKTYVHYLKKLLSHGAKKGAYLEIGCGNGFLLTEAKKLGFEKVIGVEPSCDAASQAPPKTQESIVQEMFRAGLFEDNSFDVICFFQVLDHIENPLEFLEICYRALKPGGHILGLNHNVDSVSAKILKNRSPIFDIEHIHLFNPDTMGKIFTRAGFRPLQVTPVANYYSISYLIRLIPLPGRLKDFLVSLLQSAKQLRVWVRLGNLMLIGTKDPMKGNDDLFLNE